MTKRHGTGLTKSGLGLDDIKDLYNSNENNTL